MLGSGSLAKKVRDPRWWKDQAFFQAVLERMGSWGAESFTMDSCHSTGGKRGSQGGGGGVKPMRNLVFLYMKER